MPQTVIQALEETARNHGSRPAMRRKRAGVWETVTWSEYRDLALRVGRAFVGLGLQPGGGVVIMGFNRPEWFLADVGAIAAGGVPVGIYTTSTAEQCRYITDHCEARIAVLENLEYLERFLEIRPRLPRLVAIVLMEGDHQDPAVYSWQQLLDLASRTPEAELRRRIEGQQANDLCTLIYTSGTTGPPKGVMLSHRNILFIAELLGQTYDLVPSDSLISYLPLSHIAEQVVTLHAPMYVGGSTWFAESLEQLGENLREARPNLFLAVPRVWEKIQAGIEAAGSRGSALKKRIARWARRQGLAGGYAEQQGRRRPVLYRLAERLVFAKVRGRLGLDRARVCATSTAPIALDTLEFFLSLGIPLLEVYGMSECTGPTTLSPSDRYRTGRAGFPIRGTELQIAGDGEVLMRGPHVFLGYFKNPEATAETLDEAGWLHSGDIGEIDGEGFLKITDRKKELIITSGGKNVGPQLIEGRLRSIPAVAVAVVIGDRRKYLSALLTLDHERVAAAAEAAGSPAKDAASAARCPLFRGALERQVEEVNTTLASYETIKRFALLPDQFSPDGGELTPTLKLKRRVITEKYAKEIEALYT